MGKVVRVTLDIELRHLTAEEIADSGADQMSEDCQPTGDDDDLEEVDPENFGDMVAFAIETSDDMWGGSSVYAAVDSVTVVSAAER